MFNFLKFFCLSGAQYSWVAVSYCSWEEKLPTTKSALENTWLYHEIGRCHLEMNHAAEAKEYGEKSLEAATEAADELWQLNASVLIAQSHGQQSASSTVFLYTSSCCRQHVARINIAMLHKFAVYREPFPHLDQTWQAQFPSCCAGNMELSNATSPFTNHQPRSVPDWTQIPPVHECLLMTLLPRPIEE